MGSPSPSGPGPRVARRGRGGQGWARASEPPAYAASLIALASRRQRRSAGPRSPVSPRSPRPGLAGAAACRPAGSHLLARHPRSLHPYVPTRQAGRLYPFARVRGCTHPDPGGLRCRRGPGCLVRPHATPHRAGLVRKLEAERSALLAGQSFPLQQPQRDHPKGSPCLRADDQAGVVRHTASC